MSLTAVVLLMISAGTHAGWNVVGKRQHPTAAFFLVANIFGGLGFLPVFFYNWGKLTIIPVEIYGLSMIGGFFCFVYFAALAAAYRSGDMSIAYPLSLSLPVILVLFFTLATGGGQELSGWCLVGMVIVAFGCFALPMKRFSELHWQNYMNACCLFGLLSSIGIAGLTVADYAGINRLCLLPGRPFGAIDGPLTYLVCESAMISACLTTLVIFIPAERRSFVTTLRSSKSSAAIMGVGMYLAYVLILFAMLYVSDASYVAAFRQLSIPLGATLGIVLLKEPRYLPKLIGIVAVYGGLVLVGMG